jgi:hypothetical protein
VIWIIRKIPALILIISQREVKVSRDGTEIEPSVGQKLLEEWDRAENTNPNPPQTPSTMQPISPVAHTSPTQTFLPRGRGRGRGGWGRHDAGV